MFIFIVGFFLFLIGLELAKKGLQKLAGTGIKNSLTKIQDHKYLSLSTGIFFTSVLQSSSAVSIILIGLIEAELMDFKNAFIIMLGANIGTTVTVQLISFPVLSSYPYLIITGILFLIFGFFNKLFLKLGKIVIAFGLVFFGLDLMTSIFVNPEIRMIFYSWFSRYGHNNYYGIIFGLISTALVQSSSAVTGILVTLGRNNIIGLSEAVAIAAGSNIGTCFTAFLASFNSGKTSRKLAIGHLFFNLTGVLILLAIYDIFIKIVSLTNTNLSHQIANAHTIFNILTVIIFLPFLDKVISFYERSWIKWK
ncbi:MAG: Na/Pi cotransporter family protein [Bacillota bacterium]